MSEERDKGLWRDLTSYWLLGLCNNYGYVVMLSAAHDIIGTFEKHTAPPPDEKPKERDCHLLSTGAILLADIMPSLIVKIFLPFLPFWVNVRIFLAIALSASGFIMVAIATEEWHAIFGVVLTSASAGIGEATFMAHTAMFNKNVVSTWSSGTGGAGIVGSMSYALLIGWGLSPRNTMLVMLVVPGFEAIAFWIILRHPDDVPPSKFVSTAAEPEEDIPLGSFWEKMEYIKKLFKYMIPLMLVYLFEYFINQGLFELTYFSKSVLDKPAQYRWFNVDYQIGVFISRSSVNIIQIDAIWLMAVFQFFNVVYFLTEVLWWYTPSIWIAFAIVFWEGLLGGGGYVNTFYRMSKEIPPGRRLFALAVVTQADSYGIAMAGFLAMPVHNAICEMPAVVRKWEW